MKNRKINSSTIGAIATAKTMIIIRSSMVRDALKNSTMFCLLEPPPKNRRLMASEKTDAEKSPQCADIKPAKSQKSDYDEYHESAKEEIGQEITWMKLKRWIR